MKPQTPCPAAPEQDIANRRRPGRDHRSHRHPQAQVIVVSTVIATATLLAACGAGSGGTPNAGGSPNSASAVAYTQCVRSHGVPDYPGPNTSGQLQKITPSNEAQLGVSDSRFNAAQVACQRLWPYQAPTQAQQRQQLAGDVKFAQCMRSHGLPDFPDPTTGPDGPSFVISVSRDGFNPHSPQILAKARECLHVLPTGTRLPSVTVSS
jgi:hypothetical protein